MQISRPILVGLSWGIFGVMLGLVAASVHGAEDADGEQDATPLAIRQSSIKQRMAELDQKILRLIKTLAEAEPEQAQRLTRALIDSKKRGVEARMQTVRGLLNKSQLDSALKMQTQTVHDLQALLKILLAETDEFERLRRKIERLQRWQKKIQKISQDEFKEKRASEKNSQREQELDTLRKQIATLKKITAQQKAALTKTRKMRQNGSPRLPEQSQEQAAIRKRTQELLEAMVEAAIQNAGETKKQQRELAKKSEPGLPSIQKATERQKSAAQNLREGRGRSGEQDQQKALAALKEALAQLQKEKARLETPPRDELEQLKKAQDDTEKETAKLVENMAQAQKDDQAAGESGESSESQNGKPSVQQAQQAMAQASKKLAKKKAPDAAKKQEEALKKLQKAQKDLKRQLAKLQQKQKEDLLALLQKMFQDMLDQQQRLTKSTLALEAKRTGKKKWTRQEELRCAEVAAAAKKLSTQPRKALALMDANGSAIIFKSIVSNLREDMLRVGERLAKQKTAAPTQRLEKDIEDTLKDLLAALDQAQDDAANKPPEEQKKKSSEDKEKDDPLISILAELKLLRATQKRVNRQTKSLAELSRVLKDQDALKGESRILARRQGELGTLTKELLLKLQKAKTAK